MGGDVYLLPSYPPPWGISIHTTRVGGDHIGYTLNSMLDKFQSTPPVWVVTTDLLKKYKGYLISIHTTRVGGDVLS